MLGRWHLEQVLREYAAHHNAETPHRGLDLRTPEPRPDWSAPPAGTLKVHRRNVLGGLIHEYGFGFLSRIGGLCARAGAALLGRSPTRRPRTGQVLPDGGSHPSSGKKPRTFGCKSKNSYSEELVVEVDRLMRKPTTPTAATTASRRMSFFMRGACHGVYGRATPLLRAP